ncbi:MAG: 5-formyltetrahydrofolate cyclo-ligase [Bacteroidales bacterium]|nr:5-formyltetrahydrofolate cyclo-ligase [Bacteroidales bacterium]
MPKKKNLSNRILQQIEETEIFQQAKTVMVYWSMDDEVFTHDFVQKWAKHKTIILPVVNGDQLELKVFSGLQNLISGDRFGIPEPKGELFTAANDIDLIIVPGVAFDNDGNRMGRGKAYYDKLLRASKAYKMGICFPFQIFDTIPYDELDVRMDLVIF